MIFENLVNKVSRKLYDQDYMPGVQGVISSHPGIMIWLIPLTINLLIVAIVIWLWISEVDVISPATGKIITNSGIQLIQARETSVVDALHVKEGDVVAKGQLLVKLRDQDRQADVSRLQGQIDSNKAKIFRLNMLEKHVNGDVYHKDEINAELSESYSYRESLLLDQQILTYDQEYSAIQKKISREMAAEKALVSEINKLKKLLPFARKRIERAGALAKSNMISETEYDVAQEEYVTKQEELVVKKNELERTRKDIELAESDLLVFERKRRSAIIEEKMAVHEELDVALAEYDKAYEALGGRELRASLDGIVYGINVKTVGGVVQSGDVLMQIIPADSPLEMEARILNRDIGFVREGQSVKVKLDAFPFTKYGYIEGVVRRVDRASVLDEKLGEVYPAIIELKQHFIRVDNDQIQLIPGMTGMVDMMIGQRTLMEYILTPVYRYQDEALRER